MRRNVYILLKTPSSTLSQFLWFNTFIKIKNKLFYFTELSDEKFQLHISSLQRKLGFDTLGKF